MTAHIAPPNYTQIPNVLIDDLMRHLTATEFICMVVIMRHTRGWHRERDSISITQFQALTGIKSKATIYRALERLARPGIDLIKVNKRLGRINTYELGAVFTGKTSIKNDTGIKKVVSKISTSPVSKISTGSLETSIKNLYSTKEIKKKEKPPPQFIDVFECGENMGMEKQASETWPDYRLRVISEMSIKNAKDALQGK